MIRRIVLLLACVLASGCFVFDEIDSGTKIMEQNSAKKPAAAPGQPAQNGQAPGQAPTAGGDAWWAKAKSLSGPPTDQDGKNPAVTCTVGRSTRFMRKLDCLSQGGHPAS